MRLFLFFLFIVLFTYVRAGNLHGADAEDNEFAEFEDFDDTEKPNAAKSEFADNDVEFEDEEPTIQESEIVEDAVVETEDDEFESLDPDEFEGLPGDDTIWENDKDMNKQKKKKKPELKIADVPLHLRSWDKYYVEILMALGLLVYLISFFIGKAKNNSIASFWLRSHLDYLQKSFALVGDNPQSKKVESTKQLLKESEHVYTLWCSGRQCCEGMLVELKLLKRQDLISVIAHRMKPSRDQVTISISMISLPSIVFCVGNKKSVSNLHKNMQDLVGEELDIHVYPRE